MKILFRIPFTEYYLARDIKLCFLRKVWAADYPDWMLVKLSGFYGWIKIKEGKAEMISISENAEYEKTPDDIRRSHRRMKRYYEERIKVLKGRIKELEEMLEEKQK